MSKNIFDGVIFDLDGTLWDSSENVAHSWNTACGFQKFNKYDIKSVMGLTMEEIALKFFPDLAPPQRAEIMNRCCKLENEYLRFHGGSIYPNTEKTLRTLAKSYKLFIVSNCQKGYIEAFLGYYKLGDVITDTLCWGDTIAPKADNISAIINRHGLKNPLYVGDTQGDCNSAYKAKAKFAFASYGFGNVDKKDFHLRDISELLNILKPVDKTKSAVMSGADVLGAITDIVDFVTDIID